MELEIKVGNLIDECIIHHLLQAVPEEDKHDLQILVKLRPTEKPRPCFYGEGRYTVPKERNDNRPTIEIFMWAIVHNSCRHSQFANYYRRMFVCFAETFFHEFGHHHDYLNNISGYVSDDVDYSTVLFEEKERVEKLANSYAYEIMTKAWDMDLIRTPDFGKCRFFKMWRDKFIDEALKDTIHNPNFTFQEGSSRIHVVCALQMLRKAKLTKEYKIPIEFTAKEMLEELDFVQPEIKINIVDVMRRLFVPYYYISRSERKYAYYSHDQLLQLGGFK